MAYEFWNKISDRKTAHERILTSHRNDLVLPFDNSLVEMVKHKKINTALDFGCGVGRNTYNLVTKYDSVHGYDFPNMTKMLQEDSRYETYKNKITLYNNWEEVKNNKYDAIFAFIVFQHITKEDLLNYLEDMKNMTDTLVILTRGYLDYDVNNKILPILLEHFEYEIEPIPDRECTSNASGETHYRIVMRPRK